MRMEYRKWFAAILSICLVAISSCSSESGRQQSTPSSPTPTATPTATPTPQGTYGPFVVEQTMVLGGEAIEGQVCSTMAAFEVNVKTPAVSFLMKFVPETAEQGRWTWDYSIPSGGPETHDAAGSYTISQPGADGKLLLLMEGVDSVAGNGFALDQTINYEFKLSPSSDVSC